VELANEKCVPCRVDIPPMKEPKAQKMLEQIEGWSILESSKKIQKELKFKDFLQAMEFVNKVAQIAQEQGHHPDISISYSKVALTLYTHKINGLHENDFILAAKIDKIK